jgi:hypothetical protein
MLGFALGATESRVTFTDDDERLCEPANATTTTTTRPIQADPERRVAIAVPATLAPPHPDDQPNRREQHQDTKRRPKTTRRSERLSFSQVFKDVPRPRSSGDRARLS